MEAKAQILVVDDDVGLASNLKDILEGQGYNVAVAHDGQEALAVCRETVFDLVLVDIKLPGMPGLEVIDKLTDLSPPTEYIIITGHGSIETAIEGVKHSKVLAYETKPLDMDRLLLLTRQVVERRRAEEAMRESQQRLRSIFEHTHDGIALVDEQGTIIDWSPGQEVITGLRRDEALGRPAWEVMPRLVPEEQGGPVTPEQMKAQAQQMLREGPPPQMSLRQDVTIQRPDGTLGTFEEMTFPIETEKGFMVGVICRDITERKQAEEALRRSEEKYRTILDEMDEGYYELDLNGNLTFCNDSYRRALGYSAEEIAGMDYAALVAEADRDRMYQIFTDIYRKGKLMGSFTCQAFRKDGGTITVESSLIIDTDITERKLAEKGLQESEEKYRRLFELGSDALFLIEIETGRIIDLNDSAIQMYGYSREEALQMKNTDFSAEPDKTRSATLESEEQIPLRYHRRKDGTIFPTDISVAYFAWRGKEVCIAAIRDITERKQAEETLRQSEERYRTILESIEDSYFEMDLAGNYTFVNDANCRIMGYSREEMIGMSYRAVMPQQDAKAVYQDFNRVYRTGEPITGLSYTFIHKDGVIGFGELAVSPLRNEKGEVIGFRGVGRDVTERVQTERDRRELEQKAQLSSRLASVGEMASGIAHEINNPLTSVIGYAELLMQTKNIPQDAKEGVEVIHEGAERVAGIVKRLLTFARRTTAEKEYVSINDIIATTLALQDYELETGNIKVDLQLDPDLPVTVASSGQLQQVFLNLIINAKTEMESAHGKGQLSIKTERLDDTIRISFKDDGPGIRKENLDRIFDPFFTTREVGQGTGLGLSVCHGIVIDHGGRIYVESKPGKGATFVVELPIVRKAEQLELAEPDAGETQRVAAARILVVDDEPRILQFLSKVLTDEGHEVETVDNAGDALGKVGSEGYSLILLDIKMPGMSGIDLYKRLKKTADALARRIVFITGDVMGVETANFLSKTKAPYITKPFDTKQLKKEINRILTETRS